MEDKGYMFSSAGWNCEKNKETKMSSFVKGDHVKDNTFPDRKGFVTEVVSDTHVMVRLDDKIDDTLYHVGNLWKLWDVKEPLKKGDRVHWKGKESDTGTVMKDEDDHGVQVLWDESALKIYSNASKCILDRKAEDRTARDNAIEATAVYLNELKTKRAELDSEINMFEANLKLIRSNK
jgi:hypothetical protein